MKKRVAMGMSGLMSVGMVAGLMVVATPAQARERSVFGQCSAGNPFEFSVDVERRKVDFDFDIERGQRFERWTVNIKRDGKRIVKKQRLRADEDGDVSREYVRRSNSTQPVVWEFRARSASGNTCKATLRN